MKKQILLLCTLALALTQYNVLKPDFHKYFWANYQQFAGNMTNAGSWYQELFASQNIPIYCYKGYIHYLEKTGKPKDIIALTQTINETFKQDADLQLKLVNALKKDNQNAVAAKQLVHAYETFPFHTQIVFETASMYIAQKDLSNALHIIDKLLNNVSSQSNFFVFHFMKAQLYVQLNQLEKALESIKKSLDMHESFDQGWLIRATIEEELGHLNDAIAGYTNFLRLTPQPNQQVAHHLMQLSVKQKMLQANASTLLANQNTLDQAIVFYQQKNYKQALESIEAYLSQSPRAIQARLMKIQLLADMQQFNRAIAQLQAWIYENQNDEIWFQTLHILAQRGVESAHIIKTLESLHAKYPQNKWALLYLTDLYLRTNTKAKAITLLEKSTRQIEDKDLLTKVFFQLGLLYFEKRDYRTMQTTLEKGLNLNTNFLPLMNLLAYHYATKGHNLIKAEELITRILAHNKTDPHLLDTHALVLYKKKEYAQALTLLQRIQKEVPHDATVMLHVALTHHKLNNLNDAHSALRNAQSMAKSTYEKNKVARVAKKWNMSKSINS